jgi:hypothetical protein
MVEGLDISECDAAMEAEKERLCGSRTRKKKARFVKSNQSSSIVK